MEDNKTILGLLPETLPEDVSGALIREAVDDLGGGEFLTFRRESWCNEFDEEIGFPLHDEEPRPQWAAACRCGACGERWHSGWGGKYAILMAEGEDGTLYPGIPEKGDMAQMVEEGDRVACPYCDRQVVAVSAASLKNGRTYRVLMGRVENLETIPADPPPSGEGRPEHFKGYTAVVYWMLERMVDREARSRYAALPWAAVVVGTDGKIYRYAHTSSGMYGKRMFAECWRESPRMGEPIRSRYYTWGAVNNTQMGGYYVTDVPEQLGQSGEKTGLADYIAGGGELPLAYLLRQRRWPQLENLARCGWVYTMDSAMYQEIAEGRRRGYFLEQAFDLSRTKPRDMLRMNREEVRIYARHRWDREKAALWQRCEGMSAKQFQTLAGQYRLYDLAEAMERFGAAELLRIDAYLQRQAGRRGAAPNGTDLGMYRDYRRMLVENGGGETRIEIFPPNLRAAHDRAMRAKKAIASTATDRKFAEIRTVWAGLEWSDGQICALLPGSSGDLIREGKVLNHCVGSYADAHIAGRLIIFIRHARRPERSWFTLNISVTGKDWTEIQLHGYGNEWANGKRLRIPKEVRAFVDRWEREVLTPAFRAVRAAEKHATKKQKKAAGAA